MADELASVDELNAVGNEEYWGLAYLEFEDARHIITRPSVIIGRPPDNHLVLVEQSDASDSSPRAATTLPIKRKRAGTDVDDILNSDSSYVETRPSPRSGAFRGGIAGPQEHSFSPLDDGHDTEYISVWPSLSDEFGTPHNIKSISRRHVCLTLTDENEWLLDVLGRNGARRNGDALLQNHTVSLNNGDWIWFGGVKFQFNLPALSEDENSYTDEDDLPSAAGYDPWNHTSHMLSQSDDDEMDDDSDENEEDDDDEDEEEEDDGDEDEDENDMEDEDDEEDENEDKDEASDVIIRKPISKIKLNTKATAARPRVRGPYKKRVKPQTASSDNEAQQGSAAKPKKLPKEKIPKKPRKSKKTDQTDEAGEGDDEPQKKRGPGRPPKDGVMSKRARRALEKATELEQADGAPSPAKRKPKARKSSDANGEEIKPAARKPKKPARVSTEDAKTNTDEPKPLDEKPKEEIPPPPPREPSPKESDFSEEQLIKPDRPYSVCLYKVLSEVGRPLALPEIYEEFKKRWPYYRFRVSGEGWQSSIRHNLQSTKCVVQAGRHGKGHLWTVDPNIPLDHRTTNRINPPSFGHHTYYGSTAKPVGPGFHNQNPQTNQLRSSNAPVFQGQQNMTTYQATYPQTTANYAYNQHQSTNGQQAGSAQYHAPSNSATMAAQQQHQGASQVQRNGTQFTSSSSSQPGQSLLSKSEQTHIQQPPNQIGVPPPPPPPPRSTVNTPQTPLNAPVPKAAVTASSGQTLPNNAATITQPNASSVLVMDQALMKERLQVFSQFRDRLLSMAQNETQRRYYEDILEQGQQWCMENPNIGAIYDGSRNDVGQIVKAFQEAWQGHLKKKGLLKDQDIAAAKASTSAATAKQK